MALRSVGFHFGTELGVGELGDVVEVAEKLVLGLAGVENWKQVGN